MASAPAAGPKTSYTSGCSKTTIAGGFIAIQAPLGKSPTIEQDLLAYAPYSPSLIVVPSIQYAAQITSLFASGDIPHDAVEKYVFTATYLI